jgi:mono/diheme cytochrome c family protein
MNARALLHFSLTMLVAAVGSASAQEPGNPQRGLAIARDVCAGCHAVENSDEASPNRMAPGFRAIAMTPGMTEMALHAALRMPHIAGSMPLVLPNDIDVLNVIAYIRSLDTR